MWTPPQGCLSVITSSQHHNMVAVFPQSQRSRRKQHGSHNGLYALALGVIYHDFHKAYWSPRSALFNVRGATQGHEYQREEDQSQRLATTVWMQWWTNEWGAWPQGSVSVELGYFLEMMSKEQDWDTRQIPPVLTSCDFVLLGLSSLPTVSLSHHLRTSNSHPRSSATGNSEVSIISCLSSHSDITWSHSWCSQIQKSLDNPTLVVSLPRVHHCLFSSSWERKVSYDNAKRTLCPHAGATFDPAGQSLNSSNALWVQEESGPRPPLPCCALLSLIRTVPTTRHFRGRDPSDVLRWLFTFKLCGRVQGHG